ncbi:hypothetical protein GX865_07015 [Candidatus Saccharibacteria bacterium]|jgi:hypothetical protein|nr:hypothetical protein [Candidatus Saccharibacteria bacterium]
MAENKTTEPNRLQDVASVDELIQHLRNKGKRHRSYRHYTNCDGVVGMIDSGYLWLSRGDIMNDRQELTKGSPEEWPNIYLASFVYGESENVAMWAIYGLPHNEAACISFPNRKFHTWVTNITELYNPKESYERVDVEFDVDLADVVYVGGKRGAPNAILKRGDDQFVYDDGLESGKLYNLSNEPKLTGYIKNIAWAYENEVRIRVKLRNNHTNRFNNLNRIAIRLPEDFFVSDKDDETISITSGPWKDKTNHDIFMEALKRSNRYPFFDRKLNFKDSEFDNLVRLKELCELYNCGQKNTTRRRIAPSIFQGKV